MPSIPITITGVLTFDDAILAAGNRPRGSWGELAPGAGGDDNIGLAGDGPGETDGGFGKPPPVPFTTTPEKK